MPHLRLCIVILLFSVPWKAYAYNALEECRALSTQIDDIHNCLDNYLDVMDDNLSDLDQYIERELNGAALQNYRAAQAAFLTYRKSNCVWYLELTDNRVESEQVAKNCLARMSQDRLAELQRLIASASKSTNAGARGYYVYGANRNTLQLCGSDKRYWVEGENTLIGELQQTYLNLASSDFQLMYVVLAGTVDDDAQTVDGHDGVFNITNMSEMRLPQESDCRLPSANINVAKIESNRTPEVPAASISADASSSSEPTSDTEVFQEVRAYFGDWQVDCRQKNDSHSCELLVPFAKAGKIASDAAGDIYAAAPLTMKLTRRKNERTAVELRFPDKEIDSPSKILWRVDRYTFGDILGSEIRVDEAATRQLIRERKFIRVDLLPLLLKGSDLGIEVVADADNNSSEKFNATLLGLTRALTFADDFVSSGGNI